jgi:hypothetical protein
MCAGPTELDHDGEVLRNDLNLSIDADTNVAACALVDEYAENSFDVLVYDPAFSDNQAEETYNISDSKIDLGEIHETIDALLKPGGILIHFGFGSSVMPATYQYEPQEIALWNNLGGQYDWLSCVTRKPTSGTAPIRHVCVKCGEGYYLKHKTGVGSLTVRNWGGHSRTDSVLRIPRSSDLQYEYRRDFVSPYSFTHAAVYHGV